MSGQGKYKNIVLSIKFKKVNLNFIVLNIKFHNLNSMGHFKFKFNMALGTRVVSLVTLAPLAFNMELPLVPMTQLLRLLALSSVQTSNGHRLNIVHLSLHLAPTSPMKRPLVNAMAPPTFMLGHHRVRFKVRALVLRYSLNGLPVQGVNIDHSMFENGPLNTRNHPKNSRLSMAIWPIMIIGAKESWTISLVLIVITQQYLIYLRSARHRSHGRP